MKRTSRTFLGLVLTLAACVAAASEASNSQSTWAGVYTEAQAREGETLYTTYCAECHGDDLAGIEQAPALAGGSFGQTWSGAPLRKLFDQVESMPPDEPKTLTTQQYTDILAFLLEANGLPAGTTPLPASRPAFAAITFTNVRPPP